MRRQVLRSIGSSPPYPPLVEIFRLEGGRYHLHSGGTRQDVISSPLFPGLTLRLAEVFDLQYTAEEMAIFEVRELPATYSGRNQ